MSLVDTLDPKNANIPLLEARDEMRDSGLAEVHGRKVKDDGLTRKKSWRAGKRCIYFFKPACDRYDWAKNERDVRPASHANQLTCWLRDCVHDVRLGFLFE
jgi:hypothetical protein